MPTKFIHENSDENKSMNCNDSNIDIETINYIIKEENKNIIFSSFKNLSTTNEKSFQLNSSYENLNEITKNKYIKDNILQEKTKQFLEKESSVRNNDFHKINNLLLVKNSFKGKINCFKDQNLNDLSNYFDLEQDKRSVNSLGISDLKSSHKESDDSIRNNLGENNNQKNIKNINTDSFKNLYYHKQSIKKINSLSNKFKWKSSKKKKYSKLVVNKKLNIISKNIKVANKNINNPNEFYMDFFNNIIKKNSSIDFNLDNKNNNIINNSKEKVKIANILRKNSQSPKKLFNSNTISVELKKKSSGKMKIEEKSSKNMIY